MPFALVQLQRSYGLQPRVARHALPWVKSFPFRTARRFRPAFSRASLAATALRLFLRAALSQGRPCGANLGLEAPNAFGVKNSALRSPQATMDRSVFNAVWYKGPANGGIKQAFRAKFPWDKKAGKPLTCPQVRSPPRAEANWRAQRGKRGQARGNRSASRCEPRKGERRASFCREGDAR